jgi:zinc protease
MDRSRPPCPGALRPYQFPAFRRHRCSNGLTVYVARFGGLPLVSLDLVVPAGGQHDPADRPGLATLTAALLDEGTTRRSALEIAASVERLGGSIGTGADWDSGFVSTGLQSRHGSAGLELIAEVVTSPVFPEREIERLRRQRLAEILRRSQDPSVLADDQFIASLYHGTVYASSLLGTEASVAAISAEDVTAFYRRHYSLAPSSLIAVGDLDPDALIAEVEDLLGGQPVAAPPPPSPRIEPPRPTGRRIHIVDRPGAAQTELRIGQVGVSRQHPDFTALSVLNLLIGGKFTSRINLNLRERHGYTYGVSSRFVGRLGPGPFLLGTAVATESTGAAVRESLGELEGLCQEAAEPPEIEEAIHYTIGVFPYNAQTIGELAKRIETLAVYGFPDDHYNTYQARLEQLTPERILEVAQRHLDPRRMDVVAVGPAAELAPQLRDLGEVEVSARPGFSRSAAD